MEDLADAVDCVVDGRYDVEERMTIEVTARLNGQVLADTWALNEATVEKRERMLEVVAEIDGRPLSRWGCDGVICATPTGRPRTPSPPAGRSSGPRWRRCCWCRSAPTRCSPGRWWSRPRSRLALEIQPQTAGGGAVVRRSPQVRPARRGAGRGPPRRVPVRLARLHGLEDTGAPFTDRLVAKFDLPVRDGGAG